MRIITHFQNNYTNTKDIEINVFIPHLLSIYLSKMNKPDS